MRSHTPPQPFSLIRDEDVRQLFDQSPVPAIVISPEFRVIAANEAYVRVSMTERANLIGRSVFEVFPDNPNDPEANGERLLRASLDQVAASLASDTMAAQRYDIRQPGGGYAEKHWTLTNSAVLGAIGELACILTAVQDVTDQVLAMRRGADQTYATAELQARYEQTRLQSAARQQMLLERIAADRERLEQAVHAKDEFLQIVSHELKTPITTIRGNAQILRSGDATMTADDRQSALCDIEFESLRLSRILDNLLLLARPELGGIAEAEPCELNRVIERTAHEHQQQFPERPIVFAFETAGLTLVDCVETYAEQILQNLLGNAEKYSPLGSPITLAVAERHGMAYVTVLDLGKGFTAEEAMHVFETYYRVGDERKQEQGLGIGLAVCKRLVEVMGGSIWAATRTDGGAEVGFSLPLSAVDEP